MVFVSDAFVIYFPICAATLLPRLGVGSLTSSWTSGGRDGTVDQAGFLTHQPLPVFPTDQKRSLSVATVCIHLDASNCSYVPNGVGLAALVPTLQHLWHTHGNCRESFWVYYPFDCNSYCIRHLLPSSLLLAAAAAGRMTQNELNPFFVLIKKDWILIGVIA